MTEDIRFYCGLAGEKSWNGIPIDCGPFACVAPIYGATERTKTVNSVYVPAGVAVMQDSGAFSDGPGQRLDFGAALERQIAHAERYGYASQIEARADYDCLLIDEIWENGIRRKERWPEEAGEFAVRTSVDAARYMTAHRSSIPLVLSAQGVSPAQYLRCAQQIVPLMDACDIFGLGGWCIIGKMPSRMMPIFREAMQSVIPFLGSVGVKRVHIWGVCYAKALGELLWLCDQHNIQISTDSVGPSVRPCRGDWGYASWRDNSYQRVPSDLRGAERVRHVQLVRKWLADFRNREAKHCQFVPLKKQTYVQMSWEEIA